MVTSISVALHETQPSQSSGRMGRGRAGRQLQCCCPRAAEAACRLGHSSNGRAAQRDKPGRARDETYQNKRSSQSYSRWKRPAMVSDVWRAVVWLTMRWQSLCEVGAADVSRATLGRCAGRA